MKKIDLPRLKSEINSLSGQLRFLNKRRRDPKLNFAGGCSNMTLEESTKIRSEFNSVLVKRREAVVRLTKLCTLRALMRNKIHFSPQTNWSAWRSNYDTKLSTKFLMNGASVEELLKWVDDVYREFSVVSNKTEATT